MRSTLWMGLRKILILRREPPGLTRWGPRRTHFRYPAIGIALLLLSLPAFAQQQPVPLFNTLPNPPQAGALGSSDQEATPAAPALSPPAPVATGRAFCGQNITAQSADPRSVPDRYRQLVGIFSDAAWNAQVL